MTRGGGGCCRYFSLNSIAPLARRESHPQSPPPGPAKIRSHLVPTFPAPSLCLLAYHSLETDAKRQWLIFYSCIFGLSYRFQQTLATFEIHFFSLCYFLTAHYENFQTQSQVESIVQWTPIYHHLESTFNISSTCFIPHLSIYSSLCPLSINLIFWYILE